MTPAERRQLIDALLEGDIAEADFVRLEAELTVDPAARREYYDRVGLSLMLEDEAATAGVAELAQVGPASHRSRTGWRLAFVGMTAIAAALLVALAWPTDMAHPPTGMVSRLDPLVVGADRAEKLASGFAVVAGQADAVWHDGRPRADGSLVPPGEFHLRSGLVRLELFSGVVLVVEGESKLTIRSPMEVAVARGRVRAHVPEPAHGFRVLTAAGEVIDLGTEFAVDASESGAEVHVLTGEIEWQPRGAPARRVTQGEAFRRTRHRWEDRFASRAEEFVGPDDLRTRIQNLRQDRLKQWQHQSRNQRSDPRLVACYRFTAADLAGRRTPNLAVGRDESGSTGAIVAAGSAADRWGRPNSAVDFSPAGSRVRLSVPGDHRSLTLTCWVRINSLDRWYNSLFLTDGHEPGEPHWQIMDDGRLFFSVKKRDVADRSRGGEG